MENGLEITVLGKLEIQRDGAAVVGLSSAKAQALLCYLALTGRTHFRTTLAGLLWGDMPETNARANLRRELSALRRTLGEHLIITRQEVAFNRDAPYWLDVEAFEAAVGQGTIEGLREAVELYRGDFLEGFYVRDAPAFEEWALVQATRLRELALQALHKLSVHYAGQGEAGLEEGITVTSRLLALEPSREEAHRGLMLLLAQNGQRGAALAQYEVCRQALAEDLGVEPGPETRELYERIRDGQVGRPIAKETQRVRLRSETLPSSLPRFLIDEETAEPERPVFVARERELARLDGYLENALAGQGQVAFVTGGPGRGKTALMTEFARRAMDQHPDLLLGMGNCDAYAGVGDPYLPFREALGMLTGDVEARWAAGAITSDQARRLWEALPDAVQALLGWGPHLAGALFSGSGLLSRARAWAGDGASWLTDLEGYVARSRSRAQDLERGALFHQTSNVLRALAEGHPLLLALDDLQWVDPASAGLLFHLGRRLAGARILIVGAYRPEELAAGRPSTGSGPAEQHPLGQALSEFRRLYGEAWLDLSRVEETESRRFVEALLDSQPNRLDKDYRRELAQHTEGHALFTVELLRAMQARGDLVQDETGYWVQGQALHWERLPARVEGVIAARVDRLDKALRELLTIASVEGERFTAQVVAQVQGSPERQVLRWLSRELGARHRLVREAGEVQADGRFLTRYQFAHALFQSYLYRQLSAGERRLLHREVGAALGALYGEQREEIVPRLAFHYAAAGDEERERFFARLAGEQAGARYAHAEALRYLTRALELTPHTDAALVERWELLLAREDVNRICADRVAQVADLDALERLAERMDDDQSTARQAEVACRRAKMAEFSGDIARSVALAETAVRLAQQGGDTIREAKGYFAWGRALDKQGKHKESRRKFELGLALAQEVGHRELQGDCLRGLGFVCRGEWNLTESEAYFGQALSIARELGARDREARALQHLGLVAFPWGHDRAVAENHYQQALTISQETGSRQLEAEVSANLGLLNVRYDNYACAQTHLEHALQVGREIAHWDGVPFTLRVLSLQHRRTGEFQRSRRYALQALRLSRKMNDQWGVAAASYHIGISHYSQGRYSAADPYLRQAVRLWRKQDWLDDQALGLTGVGLNAMAQGNYRAARDALAGSQRLFRRIPEEIAYARDDYACAQSALALLHHQLGEDRQAQEYARRALAIHRATFGPHRPALALTRLGNALVGLGELTEGRAAYQEALDLRRELGQAHLATEPLAGLARVALAQGDLVQAGGYVAQILAHLETGSLDGTDEPIRIYLTCYRVLRANEDPRADKVLAEAYQLLQGRAAKIEDKELRRSFLENVTANRELVAAWNAQLTSWNGDTV
jgi:adenylate cyclase